MTKTAFLAWLESFNKNPQTPLLSLRLRLLMELLENGRNDWQLVDLPLHIPDESMTTINEFVDMMRTLGEEPNCVVLQLIGTEAFHVRNHLKWLRKVGGDLAELRGKGAVVAEVENVRRMLKAVDLRPGVEERLEMMGFGAVGEEVKEAATKDGEIDSDM